MITVKFNKDPKDVKLALANIRKFLTSQVKVDVGIFQDANQRQNLRNDKGEGEGLIGNIALGWLHEFGDGLSLPARPFLRLPYLMGKLQEGLSKPQYFMTHDTEIAASGRKASKEFMKGLAWTYLVYVREGFETNGYGQWPELAPSTIRKKYNKSETILRETFQMYESLDWRYSK